MAEADSNRDIEHEALFVGIEEVKPEYAEHCQLLGIRFNYIKKIAGKHANFFRRLLNAVRTTNADVIVVHGNIMIVPVWLGLRIRRKKVRLVTVMHHPLQLMGKVDWFSLRMSLKVADKTIFLTEEYKEAARKRFPGIFKEGKVAVIPNGIDLRKYKPGNQPPSSRQIMIGMQSRIMSTKDHKTLLDAFAILVQQHPAVELRLRIAGDGELKAAMESKALELNIADKVSFEGMLSQEELIRFIQNLNIYVHATLGETMSTALMQVMACRIPVVASDVPGVNNMLTDGTTGLLVPPEDAKAMYEAIADLIRNPDKAAALADAAFHQAQLNYGNDLMLSRYTEAFK